MLNHTGIQVNAAAGLRDEAQGAGVACRSVARTCVAAIALSSAITWAQEPAAEPAPAPTNPAPEAALIPAAPTSYPVSEFHLNYIREHPAQLPIEELKNVQVQLVRTSEGYDAPQTPAPNRLAAGAAPGVEPPIVPPGRASGREVAPAGEDLVTFRLGEFSADPPARFTNAALQRILEAISDEFIRRDLLGVYVAPDDLDIELETRADRRPPQRTELRIVISTAIVTELRALASGERIDPEKRINHPIHQPIRDHSPIQPHEAGQPQRDLLRRDSLDAYLYRLSRHPGRRVDAAVAAGAEPASVTLDYLITENKPLVIYGQVSNTGTRETGYWRERFGFIHNQLTSNDDILSLDYNTAGFEDSHAVTGSYEAPFGRGDPTQPLRWRAYGSWSQYTASEVGFFRDVFKGDSWAVGGELIYNIFQRRELFIDLLAGVRHESLEVDTPTLQIHGEEDLLLPYFGARLERATGWYETRAAVALEFQNDSISPVDRDELTRLGRFNPDDSWEVLRFGLSHSFFLEPLLSYEAWRDPAGHPGATLAHELAFSVRGQYAFGHRLIPQQEQTAGGLYTVRGYPESVAAGDSVVIGTAEYRFHLPRVFGVEPSPRDLLGQPFRWAPQQVYGRPDWDLILRAFMDAAHVDISDPFAFEQNETLVGAGVGIELLIRRNFNVRVDWGFALRDARQGAVNEGSNRLHFVATILF